MSAEAKQLVLDAIQSGFPLEHDPYGALASQLELTRGQVRSAVAELRADGTIRRIGASFSSRKLGYSSTLCALAAPGGEAEVDRIAGLVSAHPEVTHNYLRDGEFNVWFTVIAASELEVEKILDEIRSETGCSVLSLPATTVYKIKVDFSGLGDSSEAGRSLGAGRGHVLRQSCFGEMSTGHFASCGTARVAPPRTERAALSFDSGDSFDVALVRAVQGDLGDGEFPFSELGLDEGRALERLREWKADGTVRRFGAFVRHRKMGFAFNGMTVWDVPADECARVGAAFAGLACVSHCYERPRSAVWPYNLYAMVHAKTAEELDERVSELRELSGLDCRVLVSRKEYKKASPVYFNELRGRFV